MYKQIFISGIIVLLSLISCGNYKTNFEEMGEAHFKAKTDAHGKAILKRKLLTCSIKANASNCVVRRGWEVFKPTNRLMHARSFYNLYCHRAYLQCIN